ncbi:MAG: Cof-type HAD-IIB family hydrolase [Pelosinus sp.]|nr:Cof-type HAD-IIB family hydrolase [Pelosinus sp.]
MKLIVSDLDGTLLNSEREISAKNAKTLLAAQAQGIEIAVATGRNYGNAKAVCARAGLKPHIICNNGSFVYDKHGARVAARMLDKQDILHAMEWLSARKYFYTLCTDQAMYILKASKDIICQEYKNAKQRIKNITEEDLCSEMEKFMTMDATMLVEDFAEVVNKEAAFGNISVITLDQDKLQQGRAYFSNYPGMTMTVAGNEIFEMIHNEASKGNALEQLTSHLGISLQDAMAIGDNYNDISMLRKAGISVAVGNAEEDVKKVCKYVSFTNELDGVAHIVQHVLGSVAG